MEGLWLSVALVCFLLDLMTLNLYTVCASIGAMFAWAAVRSALPGWASAVTFVLITFAFILLLRPALVNWLLTPRKPDRQNAYETEGYVREDE
jgi:membrane protein implicated in regulation of membrane protease activity